jgi:hypothetical protein
MPTIGKSALQQLLPGRISEKACELSGAFKACSAAFNFSKQISHSLLSYFFQSNTKFVSCEIINDHDTTIVSLR